MRYSSQVATFETRLGKCPVRVVTTPTAVEGVELNPEGPPECECNENQPLVKEALKQFSAYFEGRLTEFDLPLEMAGTPFQKRVWEALREIPYGETCSYKDLALSIGMPSAVRAVGAANGRNPIAIIVPCHRVIGAGGNLVGYGGGLPMKRMLLDLEAENAQRIRNEAT